jgi:hypothetical protein
MPPTIVLLFKAVSAFSVKEYVLNPYCSFT